MLCGNELTRKGAKILIVNRKVGILEHEQHINDSQLVQQLPMSCYEYFMFGRAELWKLCGTFHTTRKLSHSLTIKVFYENTRIDCDVLYAQ